MELALDKVGLLPGFGALAPGRLLRVDGDRADPDALWIEGRAQLVFGDEPLPVRLEFLCPDGPVKGVGLAVRLPDTPLHDVAAAYGFDVPAMSAPPLTGLRVSADRDTFAVAFDGLDGDGGILASAVDRLLVVPCGGGLVLVTPTGVAADRLADVGITARRPLSAGAWFAVPGGEVVPIRRPVRRVPDPGGARDGLGRPRYITHPADEDAASAPPPAYAVPTADGFAVLGRNARASGPGGGRGFRLTGPLDGRHALEVHWSAPPLTVRGVLQAGPAEAPYRAVVGGLLTFGFGAGEGRRGLYGMGTGAVVFPASGSGAQVSMFGFAALGATPGVGIPAFRLTSVAAGFGWNSRIRIPDLDNVHTFPFVQALRDPAAIGGDATNPVEILDTLTRGSDPWITPSAGNVWAAGGIGFTIAELIDGTALVLVQTGEDLTLALTGTASTSFPKSGRAYARIEAGIRIVVKPTSGEFLLATALGPDSFVIDPNCKLRGGASLQIWYGDHPHAGDFVFSAGGYHHAYDVPAYYPDLPRIGYDWALGGNVTVTGDAYFALTPRAAMAGGMLDVRYKSGIISAWCTAKADALIEWNPFYIDLGMSLGIGVRGSVKIVFVRITVTIEVGVELGVWGPQTGGEAKVKVWFVSFTIRFGAGRRDTASELDWAQTRAMLPQAGARARLRPGDGLLTEGTADDPWSGPWLVDPAGFTFGTDTQVPLTEIRLKTADADIVERGHEFGVWPMGVDSLSTTERVSVTLRGETVDLARWARRTHMTALPPQLWNRDDPAAGDAELDRHLTGVTLTSPGPKYSPSTGYFGENTFAYDPMRPDGVAPLSESDAPHIPRPTRPGGVIELIGATADDDTRRTARGRVYELLGALGIDTAGAAVDLPGHAAGVPATYTADPMLVRAGAASGEGRQD
ncbi:hypothetical protein B4N89_29900 [Embleya scabrispora]|uniref:DUF6603 domain-containing protein n=1 Tax=Embleya scabrispora TaxID=159449 RepID=A0A1T3P686_9ACTN|nr:hypothetical protein B4N89_29900 [Embleya scabrispora]